MQLFKNRFAILCGTSCYLLLSASLAVPQIFTDMQGEEFRGTRYQARGIAFGDYDNDGWPDLLLSESHTSVVRPNGQIALLHNEGRGQFVERTAAIQEEISSKWKGGGTIFGDYDNDGDLDMYIPVGSWMGENRELDMLLRNDRGLFRNATLESGLVDVLPSDIAIWLDYDRDGFLDLYVGHVWSGFVGENPNTRDKLYRNNGDGTFSDRFFEAGFDQQLGPSGGSNGGLAAGDFNDDGWPDLYIGVWGDPLKPSFVNRLFLNDQQGKFGDATTSDIADPGEAYGVAVGDIDNDLDLDIFQAAGGHKGQFRSLLLMNQGEGQFLDVTEGVGLTKLASGVRVYGANLADIDNDGDLDLLIPEPHTLYLNNGDGTFADATAQSGIDTASVALIFGDCDLDGFLDVVFAADKEGVNDPNSIWKLYRNNGNANHYLRVELVGTRSNRSGIGTRLIATSGELRQMREILGGLGLYQNELVAHFGLGLHTAVDQLEIRWPSGQVDILTDIPADQKIRVIEGRETFHRVEPTRWELVLPDPLLQDARINLDLTVHTALFEPDATVTAVTADLSPFGGPEVAPLEAIDDGTYRLRNFPLTIPRTNGFFSLSMTIDQRTSLGDYWTQLSREIAVWPSRDQVIFGDRMGEGWELSAGGGIDLTSFAGRPSLALSGQVSPRFQPSVGKPVFGYRALRFRLHPGDVTASRTNAMRVKINQSLISLFPASEEGIAVDLDIREWQEVEIPLEQLGLGERDVIDDLIFSAKMKGQFYLADIRLVAASPSPSITAVLEESADALPPSILLDQNFPNPFNSDTAIRFELPKMTDVELAIFNLTGQQVATLAEGERRVGTYTVHWDGRGDDGRELASGVYLYRLRTDRGKRVEMRKLLLLR
jgi:hypothetical protein